MKYYFLILIFLFESSNAQNINQLIDKYRSLINTPNKTRSEKDIVENNERYKHRLKKTISLNEYILGPNDVLEIIVNSSETSATYEKRINFSGYIIFPYYGKIMLKGKTISMAEKHIEKAFAKNDPDVNVDISIQSYREFSILVKWGFNRSNYVEVNSFFRLSDLIEKLYSQKILKNDFLISLKNLMHIRNGVEQKINLQDFYLTNNFESNPLIIEQDVIEIFKPINYVTIKFPDNENSIYEFNQHETYFELLNTINFDENILDFNRLLIYRSNNLLNEIFDLEELKTIKISSKDIVVVNEKKIQVSYSINLEGEVAFPGTYLIDFNYINQSTTLEQVIKQAGGLTDNADLANISIKNNSIKSINDNELEKIKVIFKNENVSKKISESDISYIRNRLLFPKGTIKSKSDEHAIQLLKMNLFPNDQVFIPSKMDFIEVLGAVKFPGRLQYIKGHKADQYLQIAGGINSNYNEKFIVKSSTGEKIKFKGSIVLNPGDIIFVSDDIVYNRWEYFKEILSVTSQIATIFIVIDRAIK